MSTPPRRRPRAVRVAAAAEQPRLPALGLLLPRRILAVGYTPWLHGLQPARAHTATYTLHSLSGAHINLSRVHKPHSRLKLWEWRFRRVRAGRPTGRCCCRRQQLLVSHAIQWVSTGDLSRISPRFDRIFSGEALNPIFT